VKKIFKYVLQPDQHELELPLGTLILSVAEQFDQVVMYAMVNPEMDFKKRIGICIVGTGHEVPSLVAESWAFKGTVKLMGGALMFHIFIKE
jgi:hypothetical protein